MGENAKTLVFGLDSTGLNPAFAFQQNNPESKETQSASQAKVVRLLETVVK
jgi:hypothetical protein